MKDTKNTILRLSVFVVVIASMKFLLDGVTVTLYGNTLNFGHVDALSYSSFIAPVLGAHGYMSVRTPKNSTPADNSNGN